MPRVSIVVSHFDRQALLLEALGSIAGQTYRDFEVIVVNDHGADSRALVEEFATRASSANRPFSVRYDYRPANAGVAATRNRGVALATGELIAYLDDDDLWRPPFLDHLVRGLDVHPDSGLAYGDAEVWRMECAGPATGPIDAGPWRCAATRTLAVPFDLDELRRDDFIVPSGMMHRRSLYDAIGPFDESLYVSDDWDWLLRAASVTRIVRVPGIVVTVRIWPGGLNLSADFGERRMAALKEIERRHATPCLEPKTFWEVANRPIMPSPSPARLIELATAYQRSKILFALLRFGVPTLLAGGPRSVAEIAAELGVDGLAAHRFLNACAQLGLLIGVGDGFRNAPEAQRFLVRGAPEYLGDVFHRYERASASEAWALFDQRLRSWRPGGTRLSMELAPTGDEMVGEHRLSLLTGEALGRVLDLSRHRRLLDLGGGTGAMSIALCQRFPALEAIVFELPAVAEQTRAHVRESGLDRIEVREGDFLAEPLPEGCDVVLLANVLSMLDGESSRALLGRVYQHLTPGGTVVLSGWMLDDDGSGPLLPTLLCLEDIALGAPDVERSIGEYAAWLAQAGFVEIERATYFEPTSFVSGRKPSGPK